MKLPLAVRAGALVWLAVWFPTYALTWGWRNFFSFCDMAVILGCIGIATENALLVSSQALPAVTVGVLWLGDVITALVWNKHVFGGTEYMFNGTVPLWIRLLSFFHVWLPVVFVLVLRKLGFHRRALPAQMALTLVLVAIGRLIEGPAKNLNYAYIDPVFHRQLGPPPIHVVALTVGVTVLIYLPSYAALRKLRKTTV